MKKGKLCGELELVLSLFPYHSQISQFLLAHFTATKLVYYRVKKAKGRSSAINAEAFPCSVILQLQRREICEEILICI